MADETVRPAWLTDACVEAAAKAQHDLLARSTADAWARLPETVKDGYRAPTRAALMAVAPFVRRHVTDEKNSSFLAGLKDAAPRATGHPTP